VKQIKLSEYRHIFIEHLKSISDEDFDKELKDAGIENQPSCLECTCFTCNDRCGSPTYRNCGLGNCGLCNLEYCKFCDYNI